MFGGRALRPEPAASRAPDVERFKGLLIALVVLGHNALFSEWSTQAFIVLYNFHVASFLLLPFLFPSGTPSRRWVVDRATRYLVPQLLFFTLTCLLYLIVFVPKTGTVVGEWLESVVLAVLLSSESTYEEASGFRIFWFLPALFTLVVLKAIYDSGRRGVKVVILGLALVVHLGLGLVPESWLKYIPWGLPIVLFILPLGILIGVVREGYAGSTAFRAGSAVLFIGCVTTALLWPSNVGLAGEPRVYSLLEPARLVFHDVFLVSAFFGLWALCIWVPVRALEVLGGASLLILLTHGLVWQVMLRTGIVEWLQASVGPAWMQVAVSYLLTLALCLAIYKCLWSLPSVWRVLFPRDRESWVRAVAPSRKPAA